MSYGITHHELRYCLPLLARCPAFQPRSISNSLPAASLRPKPRGRVTGPTCLLAKIMHAIRLGGMRSW